jgi:hypothetical protein
MRDLQTCPNPCNASFITRNEQESGSSPLVSSRQSPGIGKVRWPPEQSWRRLGIQPPRLHSNNSFCR